MRVGQVFVLALAAYCFLWQPGFFMNDEFAQGVGLAALEDGHYAIYGDNIPEGYREIEEHVNRQPGILPPGAAPSRPIGSDLLNVLALPLVLVLAPLASAIGVMPTLGLLSGAAIGAGTVVVTRNRPLALAVGGLAWLMSWPHRDVPADPFLGVAAIQMVGMAFNALGAALLWDVLRRRHDAKVAAITTALYAFGTPALFWALNLKYHGLAVALTAIAIWCYQEGHRSAPLRTGLAFACIGLAISNHLPSGAVLLASAGVLAMPAVLLGLRPFLARAGAGALGLGVGLVPEIMVRIRRARIDLGERFIASPSAGDPLGAEALQQADSGYALHRALWNDPGGAFDALVQNWFWTDPFTPHVVTALPFLALVPALVLIPFALRRAGLPVVSWWALAHLAAMTVLVGRGLFANGAGFDLRHAATLWPFLGLLLAGVVHWAVDAWSEARIGAAGMTPLYGVAVVIPLFLWREIKGSYVFERGEAFELTDPVRYVGLALAAALAFAAGAGHWRRWRGVLLGAALAWGPLVQILLQFGPARSHKAEAAAPFVLWPVEIVARLVGWLTTGTP